MTTRWIATVILIGLVAADYSSALAQGRPADWPWKPVTSVEGVDIAYLFYSRADNVNNGVVIKLRNTRDVAVEYSFQIVFRSEDLSEATDEAAGILGPLETRTGDNDGLFWIPFDDGRQVYEVGFRRLRFIPAGGG